jgi:hypothetical protein
MEIDKTLYGYGVRQTQAVALRVIRHTARLRTQSLGGSGLGGKYVVESKMTAVHWAS